MKLDTLWNWVERPSSSVKSNARMVIVSIGFLLTIILSLLAGVAILTYLWPWSMFAAVLLILVGAVWAIKE